MCEPSGLARTGHNGLLHLRPLGVARFGETGSEQVQNLHMLRNAILEQLGHQSRRDRRDHVVHVIGDIVQAWVALDAADGRRIRVDEVDGTAEAILRERSEEPAAAEAASFSR